MTHLKLGTRKSLLAWAQSSWVAREIEKQNPGTRVELVGIETRGDLIQDISLQAASQISGGKEFFVAEIDAALQSGVVDLTVHSMKDLSLDRPKDLINAAIPRRENPRDVALFSPSILEKLKKGETVRIGTSSPRRLENIPSFLENALPRLGGAPKVEFVEIRGNVNTRLSRVKEPELSAKHLDGVILAFAGIIRLWKDENGQAELRKLLDGVRWMVIPLRENPAAPAQGALAIECRRADKKVFDQIRKIHCSVTEEHVSLERGLLAEWGGGCHQKFGATAVSTGTLSKLFFVRGKKPDESFVDELRWKVPSQPRGEVIAWNGSNWRAKADAEILDVQSSSLKSSAYFVAHWRAATPTALTVLPESRVWTSGVASWFKLAALGVWVEGCAENLGFEAVRETLAEAVLQLPAFREWTVLTHADASDDNGGWDCRVVASYKLPKSYSEMAVKELTQATQVFWSSGSQFDELKHKISRDAQHACGPGKTAGHLRKAGIKPVVFPSVEEWKKWINED